jgi:hypothetical protein
MTYNLKQREYTAEFQIIHINTKKNSTIYNKESYKRSAFAGEDTYR